MGWSIGYDENWKRDIGYGVPAICDHPGCSAAIDRGLSYVCGFGEPMGGEVGCGLYFCCEHGGGSLCAHCSSASGKRFVPKPDQIDWILWKLVDDSWEKWRSENSDWVATIKTRFTAALRSPPPETRRRRKMRSRSTLHKSRLAEFAQFCTIRGWTKEPTKGGYEVLRMRHPDCKNPLIVHTKLEAREHLTTWGESSRMLSAWLASVRKARKTEA